MLLQLIYFPHPPSLPAPPPPSTLPLRIYCNYVPPCVSFSRCVQLFKPITPSPSCDFRRRIFWPAGIVTKGLGGGHLPAPIEPSAVSVLFSAQPRRTAFYFSGHTNVRTYFPPPIPHRTTCLPSHSSRSCSPHSHDVRRRVGVDRYGPITPAPHQNRFCLLNGIGAS